jgi:hypothetical protein
MNDDISPSSSCERNAQFLGDPMTNARSSKQAPRTHSKHGLTVLKKAVKGLGGRVIDQRTTIGKALAQWRTELIGDLGGSEAVSTQQLALIELAVRTKLLLDSIDAWLLAQPSLVNARRRALLPVVPQRQQLAGALARYVSQLGLERRKRPGLTAKEFMAQKYRLDEPQTTSQPTDRTKKDGTP